mmetsp:Transcript_25416/g.60072  ORF Transcript_25416/g.60072 Transcript_25416/m.60072 type:complete len:967 (-) Transcript_25416:28-2928(-)
MPSSSAIATTAAVSSASRRLVRLSQHHGRRRRFVTASSTRTATTTTAAAAASTTTTDWNDPRFTAATAKAASLAAAVTASATGLLIWNNMSDHTLDNDNDNDIASSPRGKSNDLTDRTLPRQPPLGWGRQFKIEPHNSFDLSSSYLPNAARVTTLAEPLVQQQQQQPQQQQRQQQAQQPKQSQPKRGGRGSSTKQGQNQQPRNVMISRMRSVAGRGLNEKYKVDWNTVLGEGAYGSVHPARLALTGEKVALKKISKRFTNSSTFQTETNALLRIYDNGGHPNISGLRDMYEDYSHFYLVMDLISGGEMFDHLSHDGAYSEADAARLVFEIASALAFLHGVGIIHADLKPENLMLCSRNRRGGTIKIIDFGCALTQPIATAGGAGSGGSESMFPNRGLKSDNGSETGTSGYWSPERFRSNTPTETGTTGYWPPERFRSHSQGGDLTPAIDIWAVGVILYIMLMGFHPFDIDCDRSDEEVAAAIRRNPMPPLDEEYVGHLSDSAKDLIRRLMEPDPSKRMTAYELLHHPWVQGETAATEKIMDSDKKLSKFQDLRYKLEASVFAVLVNQGHQDMTLSEAKRKDADISRKGGISIMKAVFDTFDEEGKGYVSAQDIGKVVTNFTGEVLKTKDTNEFLKQGNNESELSLSDFSNLFSSGLKHKHFPRGHYIFHAGDDGQSMYFLSSGKVEMQTRKGQLVAILRSGDFFGEGALLDADKKRFTTAKCATPVDVIEIKREEFDRYTKSSKDTRDELKRKWRARSLEYAKNLLRLERNLKIKDLSNGDVVYKEGDKGTSMFRVDDQKGGELEVLHGDTVVHKYVNGDSFGESSLLFNKPRSSTVRCASESCRVHEMLADDFMTVVNSTPHMASALRNMCRKRLFKRAVKQFSLQKNRGLSDDDIVAAFYDSDLNHSGSLDVNEVGDLMHRMDPNFPMSEIQELMKFVDVDEDGEVSLNEFKRIFRQFEDEKSS